MARIRTIKPEFWTSEQVMECSTNARLMFIGLWNFADDAGRLPLSPKSIKAQIFPSDNFTKDDILGWINELYENGLVLVYLIENNSFLQITGWHHQRIDKPQPPKYPEPTPDDSKKTIRSLPPDRRGKEGNGMEEMGDDRDAPSGAPPSKGYAFESGVIRLNEKDFNQWKQAFTNLDLAAELLSLSEWADQQGKKWFHPVKAALAKRNREVKAKKEALAGQGGYKWNGIEGVV